MRPHRIAYVLNIFPKLSETFITTEISELRRRGAQVRIFSLLPPRGELQHEIVRKAGLDKLVEYDISRFVESIREFQPQLIHAHFATDATAKARELSALTGIPFTFTAHGYDIHRKPPADFRERAEAARSVVTVSYANADYITKTFGVAHDHIRVIPCGIDVELFSPPSVCDDDNCIVCVARHVAVKNLGLLLDACAALRDRQVKFRCAMIGDGPLNAELKARRARLQLDELVEMPGALEQSEVAQWWRRASVGVLTSDNEGMPVCLMEAASSAVPVVATRVGGIPELVIDGLTGFLSEPGNAGDLASALERLLRDAELRRRMGRLARRHAVETFSVSRQVDELICMWSDVLVKEKVASSKDSTHSIPGNGHANLVSDRFDAAGDKALPSIAAALNFESARHEFKRRLPRLSGDGKLRLKAIRVTRHKPARRVVVEYDVTVRRPDLPDEEVTLIGKARVRRFGNEAYRLQDEIWNAGFNSTSADGISVPEPIGVIADFQMWFQRKVTGVTAEDVFSKASETESIGVARRIAEAIHKLHVAGVKPDKQHTMADELRILRRGFCELAASRPTWTGRLAKLLVACDKLGSEVVPARSCGIHRDFYPAQVIVDNARLWLIDFDLYCLGDPGLDAGNFIGHLTEQALRERGDASAMAEVEQALEERFVELSGESVRASVRAYATLTLARHIFISTRFPDRSHLTKQLLEICEERLFRPSPSGRNLPAWV